MSDPAVLDVPPPETPERVAADALAMLQTLNVRQSWAWWTAAEVHNCLGRWPQSSVRRELRGLAERGEIETHVSGSAERPLREYRAKR